MKRLLELKENPKFVGYLTVIVAAIWILADLFDLPLLYFSDKILLLLIGFLFVALPSEIERLQKIQTQKLLQELDSFVTTTVPLPVKILRTPREVYEHATQQMGKAEHKVYDLSWIGPKASRRSLADEEAFRKYLDTKKKVASRPTVVYREIVILWDHEKVQRVKQILEEGIYGYQVRYYEPWLKMPPLLEFMIIDTEEVILAFRSRRGMGKPEEPYVVVRHPDIVRYFESYYESLWLNAKELKGTGKDYNRKALEEILSKISKDA